MSRILICGVCPLPVENTPRNYGPGMRSWQLARGLALRGHTVKLVAMRTLGAYEDQEAPASELVDGFEVERLAESRFFDRREIEARIDAFRPEGLAGATIYGSWALSTCRTEVPLWADQFGHVMAEAQARAALDGDDSVLGYFWNMVQQVGRRADHLSTVSERQRYAAIGELGALGRLNAATCGRELVSVIPCAVVGAPKAPAGAPALRGTRLPRDAFVVLWSGTYNVWSDVETLFAGLEAAMARDPRIHFLSTGGAIQGHDVITYPRLVELVGGSEHRERFHLDGWVPNELVASYVAEADLGVLSERPIYEGVLGSKNRIVQWLAAGLPAVCNRVGDLGDDLVEHGAGLTFRTGDPRELAGHLLWAAAHPGELRAMAERARRLACTRFSVEETTAELAEWANAPERAPDRPAQAPLQTEPLGSESRLVAHARATATRFPALRHLAPLARAGRRLVRRVRS